MFSPIDLEASFASLADPSANERTVSPKDLMADFSAPPSGALSSFSTPFTPFDDSPGLSNVSTATSPLFAMGDADLGLDGKNWDSLFPTEGDPFANVAPAAPAPLVTESIEASPMVRNVSSTSASPMVRNASSPGSGRHSSVSGVSARRRERPLKVLDFQTSDPVASKRARNTAAARKSRAKKVQRQEEMEIEIAGLQDTISQQAAEIERLRAMLSLQG